MKTFSATPKDIEKNWILIDANGLVVGRLAALIATRLRGKHKPSYTPHMDCGDNIVVINADKVVLTGNKRADKVYHWHTGYPGGIKDRSAAKILDGKHPERVLREGGRAHGAARAAWPPADAESADLCRGPSIRTRRRSPVKLDVAALNRRMQGAPDAMSETMTLEDLAPLKGDDAPRPQPRVYEKKVDAQGRAYATGKRKDAVARVWVKPGGGKITVNGKDHAVYFARPVLQMILKQPLVAAKREGQFDVSAPSAAAVFPARPAPCATASPRRSPASSRSSAPC